MPVGALAGVADRICRRDTPNDERVAIALAPIVEGAPGPPRENPTASPPHALRRRPDAWRAADRGGGGYLSRLLEESRHRGNPRAALSTGRGVRPPRAHRRDVPRRQDQPNGGPSRPARRAPSPARHVD